MDKEPAAHIEIHPATPEQEPILGNLLELYIHDFSEFAFLELGADGRFGYPGLPLYWSDPSRFPFLIYADGKLAGLALVKKESAAAATGAVWELAEFFILRAYRRRGIGLQAALQLWTEFPGPWQVRVMQTNHPACAFWQITVQTFAGAGVDPVVIQNQGRNWNVFLFQSTPALQK